MEIFHRPFYLGYNSVGHEAPVLCIFKFQGLSRTQTELGFFWALLFFPGNQHEKKKHTSIPTRAKRDQVAWALRHGGSFEPRSSDAECIDLRLM
jgi:hypothetical protein